ncbi:MAG: hypothetical protein ABR598_02335 [Candidatus Dormibacteria bacterium]
MARSVALAVVMACALSACSGGTSGLSPAGRVGELVVSAPPSGFTQHLNAELTADSASTSTPADPKKTTSQLQGDGFRTGWARNWVSGPEDLEVIALVFQDPVHADDFIKFEIQQVRRGAGVSTYPDVHVPGGTAFTFFGHTRAGSRQVFCQGEWFLVAQYAFEVTNCSDSPRFPELVAKTAMEQYRQAAEALGVPIVPPSDGPTPRQ